MWCDLHNRDRRRVLNLLSSSSLFASGKKKNKLVTQKSLLNSTIRPIRRHLKGVQFDYECKNYFLDRFEFLKQYKIFIFESLFLL